MHAVLALDEGGNTARVTGQRFLVVLRVEGNQLHGGWLAGGTAMVRN